MHAITITAAEYAELYGCSPEYVTRKLRDNTGLTGMVSWRKAPGRTGSWMVLVLKSWYDSKK